MTFKLSLTDFSCPQPGMPQICHNFTKIGVGDHGLPNPYSSASVGSDEGWQSLPLGTLALLAGPIGLIITHTIKVNKNKNWIVKGIDQE